MMATKDDLTRLRQMRDEINKAKETIAQAKGTKMQLMKQLKEEFACTTLEQAEKLLIHYKSNLQKLIDQIDQHIVDLEEMYGQH